MFLFKSLLWLLQIYVNFAFYKYYPLSDTTEYVSAKGKVLLTFGVIRGEFKNLNKAWPWGCDYNFAYPHWMCDIRVYMYAISFGDIRLSFSGLIGEIYTRLRWGEMDRQKWLEENIDISDPKIYDAPDNLNIIGPSPPFSYASKYYYRDINLCVYIVDRDISYNEEYIQHYCIFTFPNVAYPRFEIKFEANPHEDTLVIFLEIRCQDTYYQLSCWKQCIPVENKFICNNYGGHICLTYWEPIIITYLSRFPLYGFSRWIEKRTELPRCIFWNQCAFNMEKSFQNCKVPHEYCYPLRNATFTCSRLEPYYILSTDPSYNFSYYSIVTEEYLVVDIKLTGVFNETIRNNSNCRWFSYDDMRDTDFELFSVRSMLVILGYAEHRRYHFGIHCLVGLFKVFLFYRELVIHVKPTYIKMRNMTFSYGAYVYIGQILLCYSNAVPQSLSKHILSLNSDNFKVLPLRPKAHMLEIPHNAILGFSSFNCSFTFMFRDGRPYRNIYQAWIYFIKSYIHFSWIKQYKNVYLIGEYAGCFYLTYFDAVLEAIQVLGPSHILTQPVRNFSTNSVIGGFYLFHCILTVQHTKTKYYKVIGFDIFIMPTKLCLLLNLPTPGSFLRCGHNGYPSDQSSYIVTLTISNIDIARTTESYVRIPYYIQYSQFLFTCKVMFFISNEIKNYKFTNEIELSHRSEIVRQYSDSNVLCSQYIGHSVDNAVEYAVSELLIYSEILYLDVIFEFSESDLGVVVYLSILCFLCCFMCVICIRVGVHYEHLKFIRLRIYRRNINDKLKFISNLALQDRMDVIGIFDVKASIQTSHISVVSFMSRHF